MGATCLMISMMVLAVVLFVVFLALCIWRG